MHEILIAIYLTAAASTTQVDSFQTSNTSSNPHPNSCEVVGEPAKITSTPWYYRYLQYFQSKV